MFILYDLVFLIFALIFLPVYLFKRKLHRGFFARLGFIPKGWIFNRPVWIHAVSVGEMMCMRGLIEELRRIYPYKQFVISTVTVTGNKIARSVARDRDFVTYLPFDFSFILRRVVSRVNPCVFIIAETEIWPNLISALYKRNIPVITVNGRISDSSFKGYSAVKFLIAGILNKVSLFCLQTEADAAKLRQLGVAPGKINVTGNMKFDQFRVVFGSGYREKLGLRGEDKLFVAGSTHFREEEVILRAYQGLRLDFPQLRLLIAPRHPERSVHVAELILSLGFSPLYISQLAPPLPEAPVFILDTVGELNNFYAAADIVFVGGSLVEKGGHNILEPAALGKPVIFGAHMFNFRDIAQEFLRNQAALQVYSQQGLVEGVKDLLRDNSKAAQLAKNAHAVISNNQGATRKNILLIGKFIA